MSENTSARDAGLHALGMFGNGSDRYITDMESAGQRQLVHSDRLPTDTPVRDEDFVALGFTFGPVDEHDPLFRPATLPEGWTREGSDHPMWSYLLDEKGRKRAAIFYKAAFYDRRASMSLVSPTAVLGDLLYADENPGSLPIDDLLTADLARAYLTAERDLTADRLERYAAALQDGRLSPSAVDKKRSVLARIDLMIGLLP